MRGFIPPKNDEERLLVKRVREAADVAYSKDIMRYTAFLSEREQQLAEAALSGFLGDYKFYGGYENAERKLAVFNLGTQSFAEIVECVYVQQIFTKMNDITLTHRDFLGAFLSLGIKRETLGDILICKNNSAAVFASKTAAKLLISELSSVGKANVTVSLTDFNSLELESIDLQQYSATIASLRLDAVLAAMLKLSRAGAQKLISCGNVCVNHIEINQDHYEIQENDIFTVKGFGKYKLSEIGGKSRKDRVFINYIKF